MIDSTSYLLVKQHVKAGEKVKDIIFGYDGITKINRDSNLKLLSNTETVRYLSEAYDRAIKISDIAEFVSEHKLVWGEEAIFMEWTPTEIEQPKKSGEYLVTGREYFIPDHRNSRGYRDDVVKFAYYSVETGWETKVTAWMKKPTPYRKNRKTRRHKDETD